MENTRNLISCVGTYKENNGFHVGAYGKRMENCVGTLRELYENMRCALEPMENVRKTCVSRWKLLKTKKNKRVV